jgi:hypothetical protein
MKKTFIEMRYEGYRQPEQKEVTVNCPIYCCNCIVAEIDSISKEIHVEEMKHANGISGRGTKVTLRTL